MTDAEIDAAVADAKAKPGTDVNGQWNKEDTLVAHVLALAAECKTLLDYYGRFVRLAEQHASDGADLRSQLAEAQTERAGWKAKAETLLLTYDIDSKPALRKQAEQERDAALAKLAEAQEENKQLRIEWTDLRAECEALQKQVAHLELQTPGIEQLRRERDRYREALKRIDGQGADTTWAGRVARKALAKEGAK